MILYGFICENKGCRQKEFDVRCSPDDIKGLCPKCSVAGRRLYSAPTITVDFRPGWDAGIGEHVDTKKQRTHLMEEKGLEKI